MRTNEDVIYYGLFLTRETEQQIKDIINVGRSDPTFLETMKNMKIIENMHVTLGFFGNNVKNKDELLPDQTKWGNEAKIKVTGIGVYMKNGKIMNIGLEVDRKSVQNAMEQVGAKGQAPKITHVTLAINGEKDENGRLIASPKDTNLCTFKHFAGNQTFELETKLGAFAKDKDRGFANVTFDLGTEDREYEEEIGER